MIGALGASIHGRLPGAMAALLVAVSPSFMVELMTPASDVAATCWWTSTLALAVLDSHPAALGAETDTYTGCRCAPGTSRSEPCTPLRT